MRNRKFLAPLAAIIVAIFALVACGNTHATSTSSKKNSISMVGQWTQINTNSAGWMTASISGDSIQVNLVGRDSSSIFWMGTFNGTHKYAGSFKVTSIGDQDAMKWAIMASSEKTKTFSYKNGVLSYQFSMGGSSTIVHLKKTKSNVSVVPTKSAKTKAAKKTKTSKKNTTSKVKNKKPKVSSKKK